MRTGLGRAQFVTLTAATIAAGLAVHFPRSALGGAVQHLAGDALWAAMIVWLIGVIGPVISVSMRAAVALVLSFAVEFSQRIHFPALDALRHTTAGLLVLGNGFDP